MKLTTDICELVTQIACPIERALDTSGVSCHAMPKNFAVGVRFVDDGERTRIRMRLDDARHDAIVHLPYLDGRLSIVTVDAMWKTAWERIHADALVLAQVWLDKHPETRVAKEGAVKALAILDALKDDDVLHARWIESCRDRAKHFTYR